MAKRWGEYLTAVGTSIFLPLEIWDGYSKFHEHKSVVLALCTFAINIGAMAYLLVTKRLFGIRGGGEAFEAKSTRTRCCDRDRRVRHCPDRAGNQPSSTSVTQNTSTAGGVAAAGRCWKRWGRGTGRVGRFRRVPVPAESPA